MIRRMCNVVNISKDEEKVCYNLGENESYHSPILLIVFIIIFPIEQTKQINSHKNDKQRTNYIFTHHYDILPSDTNELYIVVAEVEHIEKKVNDGDGVNKILKPIFNFSKLISCDFVTYLINYIL